MRKVIIASTRKNAGKTGLIVGLAKALGKSFGYMKPFGDRMLYRKKRLWDYDAALVTNVFGLQDSPEEMSIGFDHSKLRYMYDEAGMKTKLVEMAEHIGKGKEILFVESGRDLVYGVSVNLDAISLAKQLSAKLLLVVSGNDDTIVEDTVFFKDYIDASGVDFGGILINKVQDTEDFSNTNLEGIKDLGVNILGVLPYKKDLTHLSVEHMAEALFAKVVAGEAGLTNSIKTILVGAMSVDVIRRNPLFEREKKLIITSGDRSDMILAALESDTSAVILTNNILPPPNIIAKAAERNIPMLLVPLDTFQAAKQVDDMEPLLTKNDTEKVALLERLVRENVKLDQI